MAEDLAKFYDDAFERMEREDSALRWRSGQDSNPEQAARTLKNTNSVGAPFDFGDRDPDGFNKTVEDQRSEQAIRENPKVQPYFSTPYGAKISRDDVEPLIKAANVLSQFAGPSIYLGKKALENLPETYEIAKSGFMGLVRAPGKYVGWVPPSEEAQEIVAKARDLLSATSPELADSEARLLLQRLQRGEALQELLFAIPQIIASPLIALFRSEVAKPIEEKTGFPAQTTEGLAMVVAAALGLGHTLRTGQVYGSAREPPKPAIDKITDEALIAQSRTDNERLNAAAAALDETKTIKRSPEAAKDFAERTLPPDAKETYIPVDAVRAAGLEDHEWFRKLEDYDGQLERADAGGGNIRASTSEWLTAPEDVRTALDLDKKIRRDGLTPREADELAKSPPEAYAEEPPPPPAAPEDVPLADIPPEDYGNIVAKTATAKPTEVIPVEPGVPPEARFKVPLNPEERKFLAKAGIVPDEAGTISAADRQRILGEQERRTPFFLPKRVPGPARAVIKRESWLDPIFTEGTFGRFISNSDFRRLAKMAGEVDESEYQAELGRNEREVKRRQSQEWKENREREREAVQEALDRRKDVRADKYFRTKQTGFGSQQAPEYMVKMDRGAIPVKFNQLFERYATDKPGKGVDPESIAPLLGYDSANKMLSDLMALDNRRRAMAAELGIDPKDYHATPFYKRLVDQTTDELMEAKYGRLQDNVAAEAREMTGTGGRANLLAEEMYAVAREHPELPAPFTREILDSQITDFFGKEKLDLARDVGGLRKLVGDARRQALTASLRGDVAEVLRQLQRGYHDFEMSRRAEKLDKLMNRAEDIERNYGRHQTISGMHQEFADAIHELLNNVGIGTEFPLNPKRRSLEALINDSNGKLAVAHWLVPKEGATIKQRAEFTASDAEAYANSLKSLVHNGREAQKVMAAEATMRLEDATTQLIEANERFDFREMPHAQTIPERLGSMRQWVTAKHVLVERILDYISQKDPHGAWNVLFDRPLREASNKQRLLIEQIRPYAQKLERLAGRANLELVEEPLIPDPYMKDGFARINRHQMRILMANTGTLERFTKAVKGLGILDPSTEGLYGASRAEALQVAFDKVRGWGDRNMRPDDWEAVETYWDIGRALRPHIEELQLADTGVPLDPETPLTFMAGGKERKGGYFPLKYDRNKSDLQNRLAEKYDVFEQGYVSATTRHGYTIPLTEYAAPLDIDGAWFKGELAGQIHDIAFRQPLRSAWKLINHEPIKFNLQTKWGPSYYDEIRGWVHDLINARNFDDQYAAKYQRLAVVARENVISGLIWENPGTFEKHFGTATLLSGMETGYMNLAKEALVDLGVKQALTGFFDSMRAPKYVEQEPGWMQNLRDHWDPGTRGEKLREFMYRSSPMMRARLERQQDVFMESFRRAERDGTLSRWFMEGRSKMLDVGRLAVSFADNISANPTWTFTYGKERLKGFDHEDAVFAADKAVTRSHGSRFEMDRPKILRSKNELYRWLTPLQVFWSHFANALISLSWDVQAKVQGRPEPNMNYGNIAKVATTLLIGTAIVEDLAEPPLSDDKHSFPTRIALKMAKIMADISPVSRIAFDSFFYNRMPTDTNVGIISTFLKTLYQSAQDVTKKMSGKEMSTHAAQHLMTMLSFVTGYGGVMVGRGLDFGMGWVGGKYRPLDYPSWFEAQERVRQGIRTGSPLTYEEQRKQTARGARTRTRRPSFQ